MQTKAILILLLIIGYAHFAIGQQRVGINTTTPIRPLEIRGNYSEYMRIHSSTTFGARVGLDLLRGDHTSAGDWLIENHGGILKYYYGTDNFSTTGEEMMRINTSGLVGIGTPSPLTRLHIDGGEDASNTLDGYLMLGSKTGSNLIMDDNEIMARLNGASATLYIQTGGGNTWFGGGNVYMGSGGGKVSIGNASLHERFNVNGTSNYQVQLRNPEDGLNDWYIGASAGSWQTGDDQLLFSQTSGSLNSTLRLKRVTENTGSEAPVMITSPSNQTLYFDGNEIDSQTPLFINSNSDEETYINPSGGLVGIGTSNPDGLLTINTTEHGLGLQRGFGTWWIAPTSTGVVNFYKNTALLAYFSYDNGGDWVAVSDRRLKENIEPLKPVMDKIDQLKLYTYSYKHDPNSRLDIGVMAQETESLFPEVVSYANDQYGVCYDQLTVIGIKGIQEQQDRLEKLDAILDQFLEEIE